MTVEIYNASGVLVDTLITNASGYYSDKLIPGTYTTKIIVPNHYVLTTPNDTSFTIGINNINGIHVDDDGLYHKPGTFAATVWYDDDSSKVKNNNEIPVNGTPVQVYDSKNRLV